MQDPQHIMVLQLSPHNFSLMWSTTNASRKKEMFSVKAANRREGRSGVLEAEKDLPDGSLDWQIGIKHNRVSFRVTQPNG